jgi:hypothetical protein
MVALTIDTRQLQKLQRALGHIKNGVPRALAPAINQALNKGRTEVKREIRKEYIIKAKDIPIRISGANRTRLGGSIIIEQGMLDLNKLRVTPMAPVRRKGRHVFAQVRTGGGGVMPGAFVIAAGSYVGPFVRRGPANLPIRKLITISAAIMASQPTVGPAVNKAMGDTLDKRIDSQIKRVLGSAGGR